MPQARDAPIKIIILALSIRQPFAEEILRGIKKIEYRSRSTKIIRERFYIYASLKRPEERAIERFCQLPWASEVLAQLPREVDQWST